MVQKCWGRVFSAERGSNTLVNATTPVQAGRARHLRNRFWLPFFQLLQMSEKVSKRQWRLTLISSTILGSFQYSCIQTSSPKTGNRKKVLSSQSWKRFWFRFLVLYLWFCRSWIHSGEKGPLGNLCRLKGMQPTVCEPQFVVDRRKSTRV